MTSIHKLVPETAAKEAQPFDIRLSFNQQMGYLTDAVVRSRALRGMQGSASHFPIYRELRCAVREKIELLFDDIALQAGLDAHRLHEGHVWLDGPGIFANVWGRWKFTYSSIIAHVYADSVARAEDMRDTILRILGERRIREQMFVINWQFANSDGSLNEASFEEISDSPLLDEAYPSLGEPVTAFVRRYVEAPETVLVLQGTPGTGKTRLVRAILSELSRRKGESAEVMYTADKRVLERDAVFVEFITGSHDAFVIEDADHLLMARASGNQDLHRFLAVADGVVRAQGRKIIFTTNLPNLNDIDEALIRPGRCFATIRTRALTRDEADGLLSRLCPNDPVRRAVVLEKAFADGSRSASLANLYRAADLR